MQGPWEKTEKHSNKVELSQSSSKLSHDLLPIRGIGRSHHNAQPYTGYYLACGESSLSEGQKERSREKTQMLEF